jgi:eukaryotic-like serine/threonine-protein kinase
MSEETLFIEALEIRDPSERAAFLDRACTGDAAVRGRLERLLDQHENAGSFLASPAAGIGATGVFTPSSGIETAAAPPFDLTGTMIGPYKLLQQIGEGGMGTVYMAEQTEPVKRKVALKIIKAGMDSRQVIARFEAERQALAMMDHVNIARVFDGGTTGEPGRVSAGSASANTRGADATPLAGRPYFVMELVHGVPITKYCDDNHLTPRQRLELFVPVCQAIQHAHQKGIIHRDIKPSNVMITLYDGKPVPKVIDFGVAKATEQKLTERTLFTQYGTMVGTLEYMSPEQAEMSALGVDTRSDIYSLGVLLYELLTGSTPLTNKRMKEAAYAEILRMIKEEEPPKPSTRLSDSGDALASISALRKTEPAKLTKLVRGELDWIVMKCLEKDRNRRYETANGFAADVLRYLNDETVQACPPSTGYRLRKFVRRNRGPVLAASLVALALVGGVIGMTWGLVHAEKARATAEAAETNERDQRTLAEQRRAEADAARLAEAAQRRVAEAERATAQAVSDFLRKDLLGQADIANQIFGPGAALPERNPKVTVRELLDRAANKIEGRFADQPDTEAAIRHTLAYTYVGLGEYELARPHIERAVALRVAKLGPDHSDTLTSKNNLAGLYQHQGKYDRAEPLYQELVLARTRILGADHPDTLVVKDGLAWLYVRQSKYDQAEPLYHEVVQASTTQLGADHPHTLSSKNNLASLYFRQAKYDPAEPLFREVVAGRTAQLGADHPDTLTAKNNLALLYLYQVKYDRAEPLFKEVLQAQLAKVGADHPSTLTSKGNLATLYFHQKKYDRAEPLYQEVLRSLTAKLGADHPLTLINKSNLATLYREQGKYDRAEPLCQEVVQASTAKLGPEHHDTLIAKNNLARVYARMGRLKESVPLFEELVQIHRRKLGDEHPDTIVVAYDLAADYRDAGRLEDAEKVIDEWLPRGRTKLGFGHPMTQHGVDAALSIYERLHKPAKAEPLLRDLAELWNQPAGPDSAKHSLYLAWLGLNLMQQKKYPLAEQPLRESLAIREKTQPEDWATFNARSMLGESLLGQKRYPEAEPLLMKAHDAMKQHKPKMPTEAQDWQFQETVERLVQLYEAWSKPVEAGKWKKELETAKNATRKKKD